MASVEITFQTNQERGCSEGVWATLYFERTVISEPLSRPGTRRLVRRTLLDVAVKKIQGYRQRLAKGEQLHPLQGTYSTPTWIAQLDSEPL